MLRRLIAATLIALPLGLATAATPAGAVVPDDLTADQRAVLDQAEQALTGVHSLTARFQQVTSQGGYAQGTLMIRRPGRMRLEYDPPADVLIVADGSYLNYADLELRQVSHLGLSETPAGLLLRDDVSFADPDVTVTAVRPSADGLAEIDARMTEDPASGQLTLVFQADPFALREWRVLDANGVETRVVLDDVKTGVELGDALFKHIPTADALPPRQ